MTVPDPHAFGKAGRTVRPERWIQGDPNGLGAVAWVTPDKHINTLQLLHPVLAATGSKFEGCTLGQVRQGNRVRGSFGCHGRPYSHLISATRVPFTEMPPMYRRSRDLETIRTRGSGDSPADISRKRYALLHH
jgi:hypothetical protein